MTLIQPVRGTHDLIGNDLLLYKHIRKVGDHLLYMHWMLSDKAMKMHTLKGRELNIHIKSMTIISSRIADYKKYINLITFLQK